MAHMQPLPVRSKKLRFPLLLIALLLATGSLLRAEELAEVEPSTPPFYVKLLFEKIPMNPPPDINSGEGQRYMQFLPMAGRDDIHASMEGWRDIARKCDASAENAYDVLDEIVRRSGDTRILIINEAHDRPRHRAFIQDVAQRVRGLGYTVFSAETFGENINDSKDLPYARWFEGTYSNEPVFGSLVREVKRLGFRLARHEHRTDDPDGTLSRYDRAAQREEGQANNLVKILSQMPDDERLLVHVGYSHASEVPIKSFSGKQLAWMASRLKEKTGIDPLTISQTGCWSSTDAVYLSAPSARYAPGQFDLVVAHPRPTYDEGRPAWRISEGIQKVKVPEELLSAESRVLIEARHAGESQESVPLDRLLLWPGEALPLLLPVGSYDLIAFLESGGEPVTARLVVGQ